MSATIASTDTASPDDRRLRRLRRIYHLLLALRWIPTGLLVTVFVLLMTERGLSLAQIGVGTAAQGVTMLLLELPSGGLADSLGRKPVLVLAGAIEHRGHDAAPGRSRGVAAGGRVRANGSPAPSTADRCSRGSSTRRSRSITASTSSGS